MTREEKCKYAKQKGFTYNPESGKFYGVYGKELKRKSGDGYAYIHIRFNNKDLNLLAHQYAWWLCFNEIVEEIDHINGIRNDNRICNLRAVTGQQNKWNRVTAKGYSWNKKSNKWMAQIGVNNKDINLGLYTTEQEARNAYLKAKNEYHII